MYFLPKMNFDLTAQYITEFFSFMRQIGINGTVRLQCQPDRFHFIFLGIWNDPFYFVMKLVILLFKKIILCKDNLRVFFFIKKFFQICTETL